MKMWICRDNEGLAAFHNMPVKIYGNPNDETDYWWAASDWNEPIILNPSEYPEVTFENSPMEVEIIEKSTLDEVYKGLDQYENFLGMVACMRRAQKEANDMIAQVECYEEAMEHVKKAEELESMVDKWLEGEAL